MKTVKHLAISFALLFLPALATEDHEVSAIRAAEIARDIAAAGTNVTHVAGATNAIYRVGDFVRVREGGGDVIVAEILRRLADGRVEFKPRYGDPIALPVRNIVEMAGMRERFSSWLLTSNSGRATLGTVVAVVGAVATGATDLQVSGNKGTDQVPRDAAEASAAEAFKNGVENGPTLNIEIKVSGPFIATSPIADLNGGSWTPTIVFANQAGQRGGDIAEYFLAPAAPGEAPQSVRGKGSWTRTGDDTIKIDGTDAIYVGPASFGSYAIGFPGTAILTTRSGVQLSGPFLALEAEK